MDTTYSFTVTKEGEVIFTKDEEKTRYSHEKLVENVMSTFDYPYEDADYYARHLEDICLLEYYKAYRKN
jgi:hypothetical protein